MGSHVIRQDERGQRWCTAHCIGPDCWLHPDAGCCHRCFRAGQRLEDDLDRLGEDTVAELPLLTITEEAP